MKNVLTKVYLLLYTKQKINIKLFNLLRIFLDKTSKYDIIVT